MADINIANLPDSPLPILDGDFIHTSQSGTDFKIVMTDLADRFNLVDIFGLTQAVTPVSGNFVPISTSGAIDGNRRVSLFNMGKLYQGTEFFVTVDIINLADQTIFRDSFGPNLQHTTFQEVRDLTLNMNVGFASHASPLTTDRYMVFDSVATEAKFITGISLQGEMTDPANFSDLPLDLQPDDAFIVRQDSTNLSRRLTYSTLETSIVNAVGLGNFVALAGSQTITGTKTFTSATGIKTDKIVEATGGTGVLIDGVKMIDNDIDVIDVRATSLSGKFIGTSGDTTNHFLDNDGTDFIVRGFQQNSFRAYLDDIINLGESGFRWKKVFTKGIDCDEIVVFDRADLPLSGTFIGTTNLIDPGVGNTITKSLLPVADSASEIVGLVLFATDDEVSNGLATTRVVSPKQLKDLGYQRVASIKIDVASQGATPTSSGLPAGWTVANGGSPSPAVSGQNGSVIITHGLNKIINPVATSLGGTLADSLGGIISVTPFSNTISLKQFNIIGSSVQFFHGFVMVAY